MPREARAARRVARALRGAWELVLLDVRVLTGSRLVLVLLAEAAVFAGYVLDALLSDDPPDPEHFYVRTVVLPGLLPAVALGMSCILLERDVRHLEMTFASSAGLRKAWVVRLGGLGLLLAASSVALALGTWLAIRGAPNPLAASAHATLALAFFGSCAAFLSLVFRSASAAGLATTGLALGALVLHLGQATRWDPLLNPFAAPPGDLDPTAWFRLIVFNRSVVATVTGLFVAGTLALVRRRERLLA